MCVCINRCVCSHVCRRVCVSLFHQPQRVKFCPPRRSQKIKLTPSDWKVEWLVRLNSVDPLRQLCGPSLVPERQHYYSFYSSQMPQGESWHSEFMPSPERVRRKGREWGKDPVSSESKLRPARLKASPRWESRGFVCLFRVQRVVTGRWDSTTQKNENSNWENLHCPGREKIIHALCGVPSVFIPLIERKGRDFIQRLPF